MSTRHAEPDAPLSFERYRSHPEFKALAGLPGQHVAAKAALQTDPRAKPLLMFLQALSLRPGGIKKIAADFLAMFPERIGTPSMHKFGMKPGQVYNAEQVRVVRREVEGNFIPLTEGQRLRDIATEAMMRRHREEDGNPEPVQHYIGDYPLRGEYEPAQAEHRPGWTSDAEKDAVYSKQEAENQRRKRESQKHPLSYPASVFVEHCRAVIGQGLERLIVELCIDPCRLIRLPGTTQADIAAQQAKVMESFSDPRMWQCEGPRGVEAAEPNHFRDLMGALLEFKARHEQAARDNCADTKVARMVFRTLSRGLRARKAIVAAEGVEGIGKSFNGEAWCEQHLGEARFVRIRGNQNETSFYSAVWVACGLGSPTGRKVSELRSRVDRFLELSGMMLVIEEAHRLLPQSERIYSQPALLNWIYGLWDMGVPCALLVTPQFISRLDAVERQTDWNSGQLKRRIDPWVTLPPRFSEPELRLVVEKHAPGYTENMIAEMVDFAAPLRHQLDAITRVKNAAEFIAAEAGREGKVSARDLLDAIEEAQQTASALTTPLDLERQSKGGRGRSRPRRGSAAADLPPDTGSAGADEPGEDTLADMEPPARPVTPRRAVAVPA